MTKKETTLAHKYPKDLTGLKFGRLTVLKQVPKPEHLKYKARYWLCECDCGNDRIVPRNNLIKNNTTSCGCLNKEIVSNMRKDSATHDMTKTRFYGIWRNMKYRCNNKNCRAYPNYGGRGISVCDRWDKFENFYEDMYESYQKHLNEYGEKQTTLDRKNNNGNYESSNCRWATYEEQLNNRIR